MIDDEDLPRKKSDAPVPRKLEGLSQEDLNDYLSYLDGEIQRTRDYLNSKSSMVAAAQALFGKKLS